MFPVLRSSVYVQVVPMLQQLYEGAKLKPFQRYLLLIMFLLFTQDAGFCDNAHQRIVCVPFTRLCVFLGDM